MSKKAVKKKVKKAKLTDLKKSVSKSSAILSDDQFNAKVASVSKAVRAGASKTRACYQHGLWVSQYNRAKK